MTLSVIYLRLFLLNSEFFDFYIFGFNRAEQSSAIKCCLRNEISAVKTLRMLRKAFGDSTKSQKNVYKWYKDFKQVENVLMTWITPALLKTLLIWSEY